MTVPDGLLACGFAVNVLEWQVNFDEFTAVLGLGGHTILSTLTRSVVVTISGIVHTSQIILVGNACSLLVTRPFSSYMAITQVDELAILFLQVNTPVIKEQREV